MKRRGAKVARTLADDINALVTRYRGPRQEWPDALGAAHVAEVRRRVAALRAAAAVIQSTHDEGWHAGDAYAHDAHGSQHATIGAWYRWTHTADPAPVLALAAGLDALAAAIDAQAAPAPTRRGPKRDALLRALVRDVATVCAQHGIAMTDHAGGRAAGVLVRVMRGVGWVPLLGDSGLRRYLRMGRAWQQRLDRHEIAGARRAK